MKIAIIADSLALPRGKDWGDVPYEQTYPYLLDMALRSSLEGGNTVVVERGMRFRTIEKVLEEWNELVELRKVDIAVVHVGIVDCAPRVFTPGERKFIENFLPGFFREPILNFVAKNRKNIITFRKKRVYVPEPVFREKLKELVSRAYQCGLKRLFIVNIIVPPEDLEKRSPGYQNNANIYNKIINEFTDNKLVNLIDLNGLLIENGGVEKLTCDGMHINAAGHRILADRLVSEIGNLNSTLKAS